MAQALRQVNDGQQLGALRRTRRGVPAAVLAAARHASRRSAPAVARARRATDSGTRRIPQADRPRRSASTASAWKSAGARPLPRSWREAGTPHRCACRSTTRSSSSRSVGGARRSLRGTRSSDRRTVGSVESFGSFSPVNASNVRRSDSDVQFPRNVSAAPARGELDLACAGAAADGVVAAHLQKVDRRWRAAPASMRVVTAEATSNRRSRSSAEPRARTVMRPRLPARVVRLR